MEKEEILMNFQIEGQVNSVTPFGNGHINKTFKVITTEDKYLLQEVNVYAFHDIESLMKNIFIVSSYLHSQKEISLEIINTNDNKLYFKDGDRCYRVYRYIRKSVSYEKLDTEELIFKTAQAFGRLHKTLSKLDTCLISETIKNFHNTPIRFKNLMDAVAEDSKKRLQNCSDVFVFILGSKDLFSKIQTCLDNKTIPTRIVHNDPKINNILFDRNTNEFKAVIDLDTVMPGSCLFDVGDGLRSIFTGDNESNRDTSLLKVDLKVFEVYVKGYLSEMKFDLTKDETDLLPLSVFTIAMELGMRFLEDYLRGDKYFHISFEDENLVRAMGQFALAKDVLKNLDTLKEITNKYAREY